MFATIKETDQYAFVYDKRMGVSRFVRKSDGEVSLMDTGSHAIEAINRVRCMESDDVFNNAAALEHF